MGNARTEGPTPTGKIAFVRGKFGGLRRKIEIMDADGRNLRPLTKTTEENAREDRPDWSPNGRQIALMSSKFGGAEVCVMHVNGYDMRNLTQHPGRDSEPTWSPDGTWLAFTRFHSSSPMNIFIMRSDGRGQLNLTNSQVVDNWAPSWRKQGSEDQTR